MAAIRRIGVLGAGAWGTALAQTAHAAGAEVVVWTRRAELAETINRLHQNPVYLPGTPLHPAVRATTEIAEAAADAVLLVTPAQHVRQTAADLAAHLTAGTPLVICAKGIEQATGKLMSEVVAEVLPDHPIAVLSGPTFAIEVAQGLPTAVTLATTDPAQGDRLVAALGRPAFRPYAGTDVIGAEIGGAVKNVMAIACGIVAGRGLGDNARAALIARGLAEIIRLAVAKGARPATLMGLSGLGDLVLTCTSPTSRNYSLGVALGQGRTLDDVLAERRSVAEGVWTAAAIHRLAEDLGIEMPISAAVNAVLHMGADLDDAISGLLARPFTAEAPG